MEIWNAGMMIESVTNKDVWLSGHCWKDGNTACVLCGLDITKLQELAPGQYDCDEMQDRAHSQAMQILVHYLPKERLK